MAKRKRTDSPNRSLWSTVDLLEFIRPALLAMLFFMYLSDGLSNAPLVVIVLNSQGRLMVSFLFIFFIVSSVTDFTSFYQRRFNNMVRYTDGANLIPEWVHQFRQWHIDMFESLDEAHQRDVDQLGAWIVYPHATFRRLDPSFSIPAEPVLARVPPENLPRLVKTCSSLREPPPAVYRDNSPELSGQERRAKRLRQMGEFCFSVFTLP